jgi:hypothetical protein
MPQHSSGIQNTLVGRFCVYSGVTMSHKHPESDRQIPFCHSLFPLACNVHRIVCGESVTLSSRKHEGTLLSLSLPASMKASCKGRWCSTVDTEEDATYHTPCSKAGRILGSLLARYILRHKLVFNQHPKYLENSSMLHPHAKALGSFLSTELSSKVQVPSQTSG